MVTSVDIGLDKVTGKFINPPSTTVASPMVKVGNGVASVMVPVPVAFVFAVFAEVTVPDRVNVSEPSDMLSVVV